MDDTGHEKNNQNISGNFPPGSSSGDTSSEQQDDDSFSFFDSKSIRLGGTEEEENGNDAIVNLVTDLSDEDIEAANYRLPERSTADMQQNDVFVGNDAIQCIENEVPIQNTSLNDRDESGSALASARSFNSHGTLDINDNPARCELRVESVSRKVTSISDISSNVDLKGASRDDQNPALVIPELHEPLSVERLNSETRVASMNGLRSGRSSRKCSKSPSSSNIGSRRSSRSQEHLVEVADALTALDPIPMIDLLLVKSSISHLGERRRSSADCSTWNSHRNMDLDNLSMETNVGDEIPEDLEMVEEDEDVVVVHELRDLVASGAPENASFVVDPGPEISLHDGTNNLQVVGSNSNDNGVILNVSVEERELYVKNQSMSAETNVDALDESIGITGLEMEPTNLLLEINERTSRQDYTIEDGTDALEISDGSRHAGEDNSSAMKNSTPCIEPIEVAEPLPPKLNSRQRVTTRQTNTLPLDGSLEVESRIQQPQSTVHPAASVISVRSASENNNALFSTDRQSILDTEQSLQQETDADLLSIRTPHTPSSSRPGRSYLETRRISRLDPIIEPDSRIPSALARESSRPSTSTARVPGTILVRSTTPHPGYGQASTSTLREELPTVVDSMASALDELAVLRAEEGPHIDPDNGVRPMSILYGNRPLSVRRHSAHRPASTLNSRPRSTNVCRARSGLYNWSNLKRSSSHDLSHLPPAGPDCLPGCGYSGLPCYVCSSKRYQEQYKLRESPAHRSFGLEFPIWTIFRYGGHRASRVDPYPVPVHHLNLHRRGHNRGRGHGPPPSYTSLFPEASCLGLKKCLEICRYSRITTMILVVLLILSIIYVLIIAGHFKQGK